jgi:hypothetical protein
MSLIQLFVASSRFEFFFSTRQQELPLVALPPQEKIFFKTSKLSTTIWGKKVNWWIWKFVVSKTN